MHDIAGSLRRSADAMSRAADILRGQEHQWRGEAAEGFRQRVGVRAPEQLVRAEQSFLAAGSALTGWADLLVVHQRQTDTLEARAAEHVRRSAVLQNQTSGMALALHSLDPLGLLRSPASPAAAWSTPDPDVERAQQLSRELAVARSRLSQAETELGQVRAAAEQLRASTVQAAAGTARGLQAAKELAPLGPGLLGQAVGAVGDAVSAGWDWYVEPFRELAVDTMAFLQDNHELLQAISDFAGMAASVLGILTFVPGLQWMAIPALAAGALSTVSAYGAEVGRTGSYREGFSRGVLIGAASTAVGAGALGTASRLATAARGGNMTRTGVRIAGRTFGKKEVPVGFFTVMARSGKGMGQAETNWRVAQLPVTWTSIGLQSATVKEGLAPAGGVPGWGRLGRSSRDRGGAGEAR